MAHPHLGTKALGRESRSFAFNAGSSSPSVGPWEGQRAPGTPACLPHLLPGATPRAFADLEDRAIRRPDEPSHIHFGDHLSGSTYRGTGFRRSKLSLSKMQGALPCVAQSTAYCSLRTLLLPNIIFSRYKICVGVRKCLWSPGSADRMCLPLFIPNFSTY